MVIATVLSALVAAGALVAAAVLRADRSAASDEHRPTTAPVTSPTVGADGCLVEPCTVLGNTQVGGAMVQLVADSGARTGRLRIGGAGASDVIEVTVGDNGATLTDQSLQCVPSTLSVCIVRGVVKGLVVAQVVVGRSQEWNSLSKPIASDAGYVVVAEVTGASTGPEVIAGQHRCDRGRVADCSVTKVFLQVYSSSGDLIGCTRDYLRLESLPGWPNTDLAQLPIKKCA